VALKDVRNPFKSVTSNYHIGSQFLNLNEMNLPYVRLNFFVIECVDTSGISEQNEMTGAWQGFQQTPSINASEQSFSNIKCDAIFLLQFFKNKKFSLAQVGFFYSC